MIARLSGILIAKQPPLLVIDVAGVGYEVEAPLSVFYDLPELGKPLILLTHLQIKDDGHSLFGFATESQRRLFQQLLKISGIGAKLALTILSGASPDELARYVTESDSAALTRLPGIGKKTAERIIIELRDKLDYLSTSVAVSGGVSVAAPANAASEATHALTSLGFKPQEASHLVRLVSKPEMNPEDIIRLALQATIKS